MKQLKGEVAAVFFPGFCVSEEERRTKEKWIELRSRSERERQRKAVDEQHENIREREYKRKQKDCQEKREMNKMERKMTRCTWG